MSVVVFLGPTLPADEARKILPQATYLPPVKAGDVRRAMLDGPTHIAIIDGVFEQVPSVWHKEILHALSQGTWVYGASSMGALRAAELHTFGMVGVGEIFERFASLELEDDDEVTVNHATAEFGFRALSDAMVNIRHGLALAESEGSIGSATRRRLVDETKRLHYTDRTWWGVYQKGKEAGLPVEEMDRLRTFVERTRPDLKRTDAVCLLERLAEDLSHGHEPFVPEFDFEHTGYFAEMEQRVLADSRRVALPGGEVEFDSISRHVLLFDKRREELLRAAAGLGGARGSIPTQADGSLPENEALDDRLRAELGALDDHARARTRKPETTALLPFEIALRGELPELARTVAEKWQNYRAHSPEEGQGGPDDEELLEWFAERTGIREEDADTYAQRFELPSGDDFRREALAQYLIEKRDGPLS